MLLQLLYESHEDCAIGFLARPVNLWQDLHKRSYVLVADLIKIGLRAWVYTKVQV